MPEKIPPEGKNGVKVKSGAGLIHHSHLSTTFQVRIRGHTDEKENKSKTQPVKNNGFNPVWNEEFEFRVQCRELAFLEFRVKDHSKSGTDKDIGAFCCPLTLVQQGSTVQQSFFVMINKVLKIVHETFLVFVFPRLPKGQPKVLFDESRLGPCLPSGPHQVARLNRDPEHGKWQLSHVDVIKLCLLQNIWP